MRVEPRAIGNLFGREDSIAADRCIGPPAGCGQTYDRAAISMWPMLVQKEYQMSGMCWTCQDSYFGAPDGCTCSEPCCEADIGVGLITCGSQHCRVHGVNAAQVKP